MDIMLVCMLFGFALVVFIVIVLFIANAITTTTGALEDIALSLRRISTCLQHLDNKLK